MAFGLDEARARIIEAMHSGNWEAVEAHLTAYAAAVRAAERHQAIGEALAALKECGGDDGAAPVGDCLAAVERLR